MKEKIRPIYEELQGYLSQTPLPKEPYDSSDDSSLWEQYNQAIEELNNISGKNYDRFRITPLSGGDGYTFIRLLVYRNKLGGLISRLYGEYFSGEPAPFSGKPGTVITQTQQQSQSFQIQMLLEVQSKIDEKIPKFDKGSKERGFLEKIKGSLASVRNVAELISLLLKTGRDIGLTVDQILNILK